MNNLFDRCDLYNPLDKKTNLQNKIKDMLNKTVYIFEYENLPKNITSLDIERYLQTLGYGVLAFDEEAPFLWGGFAPPINEYYIDDGVIVANPYVDEKYNKKWVNKVDCVILKNTPFFTPLIDILTKYCTFLVELELSMYQLITVYLRTPYILESSDDNDLKRLQLLIKDVQEGKPGVILSKSFIETIKAIQLNNSQSQELKSLIETYQFFVSQMHHEIGLNELSYMKKERMITDEANSFEDLTRVLLDSMYQSRLDALKIYEEKTGRKITVRFNKNTIWDKYNKKNEVEIDENIERADSELSNE